MKNFVTVIALMVSTTGIFVSLAREELRCRLGLSPETCQSSVEKSKKSTKDSSWTNPDFTKPLSRFSTQKSESKEKNLLETQPEKSNSPTIPSSDSSSDLNKIPQEINGTKTFKAGENNSDKLMPSTENITSNQDNSSNSATTEPVSPVHESNQMTTDDSAGIVNNSQNNDQNNTNLNQSIPVIPPPQTSQP